LYSEISILILKWIIVNTIALNGITIQSSIFSGALKARDRVAAQLRTEHHPFAF
jgi:hypothetical protein